MNWTALELKMQRHLKSRVRFSVMGDFLSVRDIDFFGPFSVSPNQRYILAWSDSDPLREGQLLWAKEPETGWADSYEFDVSSRVLYLVYRDGKKYAYGFNGKLLEG
jgi:hypothetical protein